MSVPMEMWVGTEDTVCPWQGAMEWSRLAGAPVNLNFLPGGHDFMQVHQAVLRSPKAPDFKGTALTVASRLDNNLGVTRGQFSRYLAAEQRTYAYTLKQQRLFNEEEEKRKTKKA